MAAPSVSTNPKKRLSRRQLLAGAAVSLPAIGLGWRHATTQGEGHNEYFLSVQSALQKAGLFRPTLVVDRQKLHHNCGRVRVHLPPNKRFRIVTKSLPSHGLLREVMEQTGYSSLMVFHQPFLNEVAREFPRSNVLIGKPMPVGAAARFYEQHKANRFRPQQQLQWLVDSPERLQQYATLAAGHPAAPFNINLELDVGLHRGGFNNPSVTAEAIRTIRENPNLNFSGFMGYEPHVAKMPGILGGPSRAMNKAMESYEQHVAAAHQVLGSEFDDRKLTLNSGGSPTFQLYDETGPSNELAMGSALVKPTDFDIETLQDHIPASFIATPVLKAMDNTLIPGIEALSKPAAFINPAAARSWFTYGGYWRADLHSPPNLKTNGLYGHSTNQEMINGPAETVLNVDDFVFLRPHQSEHVFLQFGEIAVYDEGQIVDSWPVFQQGA